MQHAEDLALHCVCDALALAIVLKQPVPPWAAAALRHTLPRTADLRCAAAWGPHWMHEQ